MGRYPLRLWGEVRPARLPRRAFMSLLLAAILILFSVDAVSADEYYSGGVDSGSGGSDVCGKPHGHACRTPRGKVGTTQIPDPEDEHNPGDAPRPKGYSSGGPRQPLRRGGVSSNQSDSCSSGASCYTPARGPECPKVRVGWGDCPGSAATGARRRACDWCYGPDGVFAYTPRGSTYKLDSSCSQLGSDATWSTKNPQIVQWMRSAGGNCASDGRGGYTCSNVDPARFKQAAKATSAKSSNQCP